MSKPIDSDKLKNWIVNFKKMLVDVPENYRDGMEILLLGLEIDMGFCEFDYKSKLSEDSCDLSDIRDADTCANCYFNKQRMMSPYCEIHNKYLYPIPHYSKTCGSWAIAQNIHLTQNEEVLKNASNL